MGDEVKYMDKEKRRYLAGRGVAAMEKLDLTAAIRPGTPRMELTGNREFYMDNHRGILSYSREAIDIGASDMIVRLRGADLAIAAMTDDEVRIRGKIGSMELWE